MNKQQLQKLIKSGEDSARQFKEDIRNADSLASEMVAFSNSKGGTIFIGVKDDGKFKPLSGKDVARINQLISNAASQNVRSPISPITENVPVDKGVVIVLKVPEGIDKPYFDNKSVIWLKSGSDKRRINSKEELRRLFQDVDLVHADEVPTSADISRLDRIRFRDFLQQSYSQKMPETKPALARLLGNLELAKKGKLNLAGLLLFGERPQLIKPVFVTKAVSFPGSSVAVKEYLDSEDFEGTLQQQYEGALAFIMRNLIKEQKGKGVNTTGTPEIPQSVFEELLVNAFVHRDYFISAPIRVFVFTDRIEIISPGTLPNSLTVEKIKMGISVVRNPILVSFISKGLLPYRGIGTGIRRALEDFADIEFYDEREAGIFKAVVKRKSIGIVTGKGVVSSIIEIESVLDKNHKERKAQSISGSSEPINEFINGPINGPINEPINSVEKKVLDALKKDKNISYEQLSKKIHIGRSTAMRAIRKLKEAEYIKRVGSNKVGYWEIL